MGTVETDESPLCYHESVLNSPLEVALRTLIILSKLQNGADLQRLAIYDYVLLHSGDIENGPASLHPATPIRTSELLVRRGMIDRGLTLLESRGLVQRSYREDGIAFIASQLASPFLLYFESEYAKQCGEVAGWISATFDAMSAEDLQEFIQSRVGKWGVEFTDEPVEEEAQGT
ncbi:MAG TPA: ABC-three component system middle component 2 [Pirellulales bacterium]|jgi:hypothetical protein|nr:ABC-three component system middle component 2 [Pirellulales bacterium]